MFFSKLEEVFLSIQLCSAHWCNMTKCVSAVMLRLATSGHDSLCWLACSFWVSPEYFHDWLWLQALYLSHHISSVSTAGEVTNWFLLGLSSQKLTFYSPSVPQFVLCQRLGNGIDDKHRFEKICSIIWINDKWRWRKQLENLNLKVVLYFKLPFIDDWFSIFCKQLVNHY